MSTYHTDVPGASGYAGAAALAQKAYANAMARYQQQRGNTLLKYGYRQNAGGGYEADPNNEYGSYQQLLKTEAGQDEGLQRAQAGSGWGSDSGYLGAQREGLDYARGGEQATLGADLTGQLSGIAQGEQGATYDKDAALYQAEQDAAQRAIDNQAFDPGDYTGLTPAPTKPVAPKLKKATPATHAKGKAKIMQRKVKKAKGGKR